MLILRAVGLFLLVAIALCFGAGLLTGEKHYIYWARRLFKITLAVAVVFVALFLLERLIVPMV